MFRTSRYCCFLLAAFTLCPTSAFTTHAPCSMGIPLSTRTALFGYKASVYGRERHNVRSKRQERVGQLVQTELSRIIHAGNIKHLEEYLDDDLRQRISIVKCDVSPDLRHARISVSIRKAADTDNNSNTNSNYDLSPEADKRRAYSWLVRNTKSLRHSLAQKLSHMKTCPDLTFAQVDVSAAVDVMYLIDQLSANDQLKRPDNLYNDFEKDDDDDDDWEDENDDFFVDEKQ